MTVRDDALKDWKVLVVDDDEMARDILNSLLVHYGATVLLAENGEQALALIRKTRPHFIITDLAMPVMNGWVLIETLKQDTATLDIPIIALTAYAALGDRQKAMAAGCHHYLTKPFRPVTLMEELVALLVDFPELAENLKRE